jgi:hypothetical protein
MTHHALADAAARRRVSDAAIERATAGIAPAWPLDRLIARLKGAETFTNDFTLARIVAGSNLGTNGIGHFNRKGDAHLAGGAHGGFLR